MQFTTACLLRPYLSAKSLVFANYSSDKSMHYDDYDDDKHKVSSSTITNDQIKKDSLPSSDSSFASDGCVNAIRISTISFCICTTKTTMLSVLHTEVMIESNL